MIYNLYVDLEASHTSLVMAFRHGCTVFLHKSSNNPLLAGTRLAHNYVRPNLLSTSHTSEIPVKQYHCQPQRSFSRSASDSPVARKYARGTSHATIIDSLFDSLRQADCDTVDANDLLDLITKAGISLDDPRLSKFVDNLKNLQGPRSSQPLKRRMTSLTLDREAFKRVTQESVHMLLRVVTNDFCIPDFQRFSAVIEELFHSCKENSEGSLACYIPELNRVDPNMWGLSICTVDGQRLSVGDSTAHFTIQSSSKPLTYAMALTELGPEVVHQYVGYEPSGVAFNKIGLNPKNRPHNPLVNSGALAICSILQPHLSPSDRFKYVENTFRQMAGGQTLGFNNAVFLSERSTADRNFAIAYYMKENRCFPENINLHELLDFYLQICSIEADCEAVSVMAATLANGGVNPLTGSRLLDPAASRDTLSVMHSCGMYDYSGQFAFKVGLPSKSGVSGVIMLVVPDLMGLALFSPLIDHHGNSVRGVQFCQELVNRFIFHHYESHLHTGKKEDPRRLHEAHRTDTIASLLFAAEANDLATLRRSYISGVDLTAVDYDGRTGLHVAASSGALDAVKFFIEVGGVDPNPIDRWGHTPLSEALHFNHPAVVEYLEGVLRQFEASS
ncbi:Glutaminase kidney isoform, mitochondrial [Clonorchis sinensis]|uniref:glutaminase n=2 Tax=Clonorchis sinensis TaxID=79923 RepID=A0A8T1MGR4_CLOSI|nr:Glutaminase kidney isoform, mitochondrial [Clonorchis sinensis]